MKQIITLIIIAIAAPFAIKAQSLSPTVIASTGGFSSNSNGSLSYTVGEMTMVQTFSAGNNILTQGFQQPNDITIGLIDITKDEFGSFIVYPNPAVDNMWFGFQFPEQGKVTVSLFNTLGQKIADVYTADYSNGKTVEQMNVSTLAAGSYFLTANFVAASDGKTHITTKQFNVIN